MGKKRSKRIAAIQRAMDIHHDQSYVDYRGGTGWNDPDLHPRCSECGRIGEPFELHLADMIDYELNHDH